MPRKKAMRLVKEMHEITLRDIILMDATKRANNLLRFWFVPAWMVVKQLEELCKRIFDAIGDKPVLTIEDEEERLKFYRQIQVLEALYNAVMVELNLRGRVNAWKILFDQKIKEDGTLNEVIELVKKHANIEIQKPEDVTELREYVQRKIDKYREMYPENEGEAQGQSVTLMRVIYSVFNFLGEPINENVRLITFLEMKATAEERVREQSKQQSNGENE